MGVGFEGLGLKFERVLRSWGSGMGLVRCEVLEGRFWFWDSRGPLLDEDRSALAVRKAGQPQICLNRRGLRREGKSTHGRIPSQALSQESPCSSTTETLTPPTPDPELIWHILLSN